MSIRIKTSTLYLFIILATALVSCYNEDPGPLQEIRKEFAMVDFDRLEMGSALNIQVEQANTFGIEVSGDQRNIDDLDVHKSGNTLVIKFRDNANRYHDTYIHVTMPRLKAVNFSGASVSRITGFESNDDFDFYLSGASVSQLDSDYREIKVIVSGGSSLVLYGSGDQLQAEVSGASSLKAFDYQVKEASINVSGASQGKITATDELNVTATGASSVLFRGNPSVAANTSGASIVQKD